MMPMKQLREGAIYSLALTPYQYTARRLGQGQVEWLLLPEWPDNPLIGGPILYVTYSGQIGRSEGLTGMYSNELNRTGRCK